MVNPAPAADTATRAEARRVSQLLNDAIRKIQSDKSALPRGISPKAAAGFLKRYYADAVEEDVLARTPDDLVTAVRAHLEVGTRRKSGEHTLQVRSTSQSRAVVDIVIEDMPFLVDSVTGEILRRGYAVRFVVHPLFRVDRTQTGTMKSVSNGRGDGDVESWMHFEVIGLESPADVEDLQDGISHVLQDVASAVGDWPSMRAQTGQIAAELRASAPRGLESEEIEETIEFLDWLADNHFTFLGYREYKLRKVKGKDSLEPVAGSGKGILRDDSGRSRPRELPDAAARKARDKRLLILTKASSRATVHRTAYLDYVGVKVFNKKGDVVGERRFVGLLTSTAYRERVENVPVIGHKMTEVIRKAGYEPGSHSAKDLRDVIETFPRDELLQATVDQILPVSLAVVRLPERRQTRLFLRRDDYGRFFSALVFLPRDRYSTPVRLKMIDILMTELGGTAFEYSTQSGASPLARLEFVIRVPVGSAEEELSAQRFAELQRRIVEASRTWDDDLADQLRSYDPDESADIERFADAMPPGYRAEFPATAAIHDIEYLRRLEVDNSATANPVSDPAAASRIALRLFLPGEDSGNRIQSAEDEHLIDAIQLRAYSIGAPMQLSKVLPILQDLGVEVNDENTFDFDIRTADGSSSPAWIYDFTMSAATVCSDTNGLAKKFSDAIAAAWSGVAESDRMSSLVLSSGFTWRQVALLRAYVRYLQMGALSYSREYIEQAVVDHPQIAEQIVALFTTYFDPEYDGDTDARNAAADRILDKVRQALVDVSSLDADRILTGLKSVVCATVRTNFFQNDEDGNPREVISFKLDPQNLVEIPSPKPFREFWVYSPRLEATHLRFGLVARGGLRWSDRREDLRTEILGLVKAQIVKNTVIVPTGAKGGFVAKRAPDPAVDREGWMAEGVACYRTFIRSMLQLSDNRDGEQVIPPKGVVRRDEDDPYLVVAADKGTATFSDFANEESVDAGFWLGDAFASGGSAGYDHKAMGITARGAWESVKRHFRELGVDTQTEDFTAVGIGDMSGDVFGNGMLLSEHIRLVAAFDHRHVFVDPTPDSATSYAERRRLFDLPRSSWADYDTALISKGGGVWPRSAKSIPVSAAMRDALGLDGSVSSLAPNELIRQILLSPVDLFWNGGIGTYVKASTETSSEVGDRANDAIRVDGRELRVKVVGEGGNLGCTQRGRIEYALSGNGGDGGRINTDAIDNSAGVDTSDHEVNIKILLRQAIDDGKLKENARDKLLLAMTDEVGSLVLEDNYDQNVALQMEERNNLSLHDAHRRLMAYLEKQGLLDRSIEFLPTDDEMRARFKDGRGLTSPELSVLLAYSKILMQGWIMSTGLPDEAAFHHLLTDYFPVELRKKYEDQMVGHPLHREIVATLISNRVVNNSGTTGPMRMMEETGATAEAVLRAQTVANRVFKLPEVYELIDALDNDVPADLQTSMRIEQQRLVERGTRWLLRNVPHPIDIVEIADRYSAGVAEVVTALPDVVTGIDKDTFEGRLRELEYAGVPAELARRVAVMPKTIAALDIVGLVGSTKHKVPMIAATYFEVANKLALSSLLERIIAMARDDRWRAMARGTLRDDLNGAHAELTAQVLAAPGKSADDRIENWYAALPATSVQALDMLGEIMESSSTDLASIVVAVQLVRDVVGGTTTTH